MDAGLEIFLEVIIQLLQNCYVKKTRLLSLSLQVKVQVSTEPLRIRVLPIMSRSDCHSSGVFSVCQSYFWQLELRTAGSCWLEICML